MFITLEGGEGAGKTSAARFIGEFFGDRTVIYTREPGGSKIAEQIRSVVLHVDNMDITKETEVLLFAAARAQHMTETVLPALKKGHIVVCDRFIDSSMVYQGYAGNNKVEDVEKVNEFAINGMMPNLTLWLDVEPSLGLARVFENSTREQNRIDHKSIAFHEKVRNGYVELHNKHPERIKRVDANGTLEQVRYQIFNILANWKENAL